MKDGLREDEVRGRGGRGAHLPYLHGRAGGPPLLRVSGHPCFVDNFSTHTYKDRV